MENLSMINRSNKSFAFLITLNILSLYILGCTSTKSSSDQDNFALYWDWAFHLIYTRSPYSCFQPRFKLKKSKFNDIKKIFPYGQYRSDYLDAFKKTDLPEEFFTAKKKHLIITIFIFFYWR